MTPRPVTASSSATTRASAPSSTPGPSPSRSSTSPGQPPLGSVLLTDYKVRSAWDSLYAPRHITRRLGLKESDILIQLDACIQQQLVEVYDLSGCSPEDLHPLGLESSKYAIVFVVQAKDKYHFALAGSRESVKPYTLVHFHPKDGCLCGLPGEAVKVFPVGAPVRLTRPIHHPKAMSLHIRVHARIHHMVVDHPERLRSFVDPDWDDAETKRQLRSTLQYTLRKYARGEIRAIPSIYMHTPKQSEPWTEYVWLLPVHSPEGPLPLVLPLSSYYDTPEGLKKMYCSKDPDFGTPLESKPGKPADDDDIRLAHTVLTLEHALRNTANAGSYGALLHEMRDLLRQSTDAAGAAQARRAVAE